MYSGAWRTLPQCRFLHWPEYRGETTITALAERIIKEQDIHDGDYLVGSAKNKGEISAVLRVLHPLASLAPLGFIQKAAGKVSATSQL